MSVFLATRNRRTDCILFILLTHEGSHWEVQQEFQPSYDIFPGPVPRVVQTTGSVDPSAYAAQLLTLHQHRANNQHHQI